MGTDLNLANKSYFSFAPNLTLQINPISYNFLDFSLKQGSLDTRSAINQTIVSRDLLLRMDRRNFNFLTSSTVGNPVVIVSNSVLHCNVLGSNLVDIPDSSDGALCHNCSWTSFTCFTMHKVNFSSMNLPSMKSDRLRKTVQCLEVRYSSLVFLAT